MLEDKKIKLKILCIIGLIEISILKMNDEINDINKKNNNFNYDKIIKNMINDLNLNHKNQLNNNIMNDFINKINLSLKKKYILLTKIQNLNFKLLQEENNLNYTEHITYGIKKNKKTFIIKK